MSTHLGKCTEKTAPVYGDTVYVDGFCRKRGGVYIAKYLLSKIN